MLFNYNINPLICQKKKRGIMMKKVIITIVAVVAVVAIAFKINALENQNRKLQDQINQLYDHTDKMDENLTKDIADLRSAINW